MSSVFNKNTPKFNYIFPAKILTSKKKHSIAHFILSICKLKPLPIIIRTVYRRIITYMNMFHRIVIFRRKSYQNCYSFRDFNNHEQCRYFSVFENNMHNKYIYFKNSKMRCVVAGYKKRIISNSSNIYLKNEKKILKE